jgi:hypothetical protein
MGGLGGSFESGISTDTTAQYDGNYAAQQDYCAVQRSYA